MNDKQRKRYFAQKNLGTGQKRYSNQINSNEDTKESFGNKQIRNVVDKTMEKGVKAVIDAALTSPTINPHLYAAFLAANSILENWPVIKATLNNELPKYLVKHKSQDFIWGKIKNSIRPEYAENVKTLVEILVENLSEILDETIYDIRLRILYESIRIKIDEETKRVIFIEYNLNEEDLDYFCWKFAEFLADNGKIVAKEEDVNVLISSWRSQNG